MKITKTYVQCPYCSGYNTRRVPIMRELDGRIMVMPPENVTRFSEINCHPKEWAAIIGEQYNFMGLCEHCQARFIIERENIIRIMIDEPSDLRQKPFQMEIGNVFSCMNKSVVTGKIKSGFIQVGDNVIISSEMKQVKATVCGIEMFRKLLPYAEFDDNCGIFLNIDKEKICVGDALTKQDTL